ncbi:MAG: hypothetical protein Q9170_004400 [Blastenia crenularia]
MAPTMHLVRHAQGYHNLNRNNKVIPDPLLTPVGEQQCLQLRDSFPYHSEIDLLVTSPMHRTLQTTLRSFSLEIDRGVPCIAIPELQECGDEPCNTGKDPELLKWSFVGSPINFDLVVEEWNSRRGVWGSKSVQSQQTRAWNALKWLKARDEREIVVVAHDAMWKNAEYRTYRFLHEAKDNLAMGETEESRQRRHGTLISYKSLKEEWVETENDSMDEDNDES